MLNRFMKPKWRHRNPEVRRHAVADLPDSEQDVLARLAEEDEAAEVRIAAVRRLCGLEAVDRLRGSDADPAVREAAAQRLCQLLAGAKAPPCPLEERIGFLARLDDVSLVEQVARTAAEPELRLAALGRVTREGLLGDVAIGDSDPGVRMAALERVSRRSTLERVRRETRLSDKQVSHAARERLEALREAEERPQRLRDQARQLCERVENLGKRERWEQDRQTLAEIETEWQGIASELDGDWPERFADARAAFLTAFDRQAEALEHERQQEAQLAPLRAARQALMDELDQGGEALGADDAEPPDDAAFEFQLVDLQRRWEQTESLPGDAEQRSQAAFNRGVDELRRRYKALRHQHAVSRELKGLLARVERIAGKDRWLVPSQLDSVRKRWKALSAELPQGVDDLAQRMGTAVSALEARLETEAGEQETACGALPQKLEALEKALEGGEFSHATPLHEEIDGTLHSLAASGYHGAALAEAKSRFARLSPQFRELGRWRSWSADRARERLIQEMTALVGAEQHPEELARAIHALQVKWKELDAGGGRPARGLWKRFQKAANEAYLPCQAHFKEQAEARKCHRSEKEQLLEELERYLSEQDWDAVDWKDAVRREREFWNAWRAVGPVDRRHVKGLNRRLRTSMDALKARLHEERERNLAERRALVEAAQRLAGSEHPERATEEIKRLQREWKTTVPGSRRDERELWSQFRAACDQVFASRRQQHEAAAGEQRANLERREALCKELESLAEGDDDPDAVRRHAHRLQGEWRSAGPAPRAESARVERRFSEALRRVERHCTALVERAERKQLSALGDRAALCLEAEGLAAAASGADGVAGLRERWAALAPLADGDAQGQIERRFESACAAAEAGNAAVTEGTGERETLCLRMEILAGVDSPPEMARARMEYQVNRLSRAMGHGEPESGDPRAEALDVERSWYLCAPSAPDRAEELEARFHRALEAFHTREA